VTVPASEYLAHIIKQLNTDGAVHNRLKSFLLKNYCFCPAATRRTDNSPTYWYLYFSYNETKILNKISRRLNGPALTTSSNNANGNNHYNHNIKNFGMKLAGLVDVQP
jgi:hypothetical protein